MTDGLLDAIRKEQDGRLASNSDVRDAVEARLHAQVRPRRRSSWAGWALAAAALVALGFAAWSWIDRDPSIDYRVAHGRQSAGGFVDAAHGAELSFTDGSRITLEPDSSARVIALDGHGASLALSRGGLEASVTHREGTSWRVYAGPFVVRVTGTVFHVQWIESRAELDVRVSEGAVRVEGACLQTPRAVHAGQELVLACAGWELPVPRPVEPTATRDPIAPPPLEIASPPPVRLRHVEAPPPLLAPPPIDSQARLDEAERSALAGDVSGARTRFNDVREVAPGSDDAALAGFLLGRLAFDQQHDYTEAVRWFSTYEAERPSGPLIREAMGRHLEALARAGDREGARAQAERYLVRFPDGPHAARAREMLR